MSQLLTPAEVEVPLRPGGVLGTALPAPQGWERGLSIPFYGCGYPLAQDRCVTANDTAHKPHVAEFQAFGISQGATCSTLSRLDQERHAQGRLDATTEYAVGSQLQNDYLDLGTPSLKDATEFGPYPTVTEAVSQLEYMGATRGFGAQWWLHATVKGAAFLAERRLLVDGKSPTGAPWVISPGYADDPTGNLHFWMTGPVWAGVSDPFHLQAVDWRENQDTAYANRSAIVAFDPCLLARISTPIPTN